MLGFWSNDDANLKILRQAEAKLIEYAKSFGDRDPNSYEIVVNDTPISKDALPLKNKKKKQGGGEDLFLHSVCVQASEKDRLFSKSTPLVILHGYMNGAMYFYRNMVGLSTYFDKVYSLDTLGCGLSSRCPNLLWSDVIDSTVNTTESVFVESVEEWRKANNIPKMVLAGHSMGGYIAVAYCERYPQNVEQLVLLSPVGVPYPDLDRVERFKGGMSFTGRTTFLLFRQLFDLGITPPKFLRTLPTGRGRSMIESYIDGRLPAITDEAEQQVLADYLYTNAILPGCGEDMLNRFLTSTAYAKVPTIDRIPNLKIPKVSFIYGSYDWMDIGGGMEVSQRCGNATSPNVDVHELRHAGHLLMLDNWRGFNAAVIGMCGGKSMLSPYFPSAMRNYNW